MTIYGVCISDIESINEEKVMDFLFELSNEGYPEYLEEFNDAKADNEDYTVDDWLYYYEFNGYVGTAAFLMDVISNIEQVNIECEDPQGIHYLGLECDTPWRYNEKTLHISEEGYNAILTKYLGKVTDETLPIRKWQIHNGEY